MMRLDTGQHMRLEQKMKLAPRMIQSMEILQLPLMALEERIQQELESNPVLEIRQDDPDAVTAEPSPSDDNEPAPGDGETDLVVSNDGDGKDDFERLDASSDELQYKDIFDGNSRPTTTSGDGMRDAKMDAMMNTAARDVSLNDHLLNQWALMDVESQTRRLGELIIMYIEEDGYLRTDLSEILSTAREQANMADMERALQLVQQLEPAGVAARDVRECLLLQLDALGSNHQVERTLIEHHLRDIELNRLPQIAKKTGYSIEQINDAVDFIRTKLTPYPGNLVGPSNVSYITPDIFLEFDETINDYRITMPEGYLPSLYISGTYRRMLEQGQVDRTTKDFIQKHVQSARWLMESIEQRRNTVRRVVEDVVAHQREFFDKGPQYLKPLPMVDVAERLGVHVATVSRAVSEKYMQTPRGLYSLRSFFSGGTETDSGESISWDGIKAKLQEIVDNEDKSNPLDDDALANALSEQGVKVARRTVAKYRKLMDIPSARRRRQF